MERSWSSDLRRCGLRSEEASKHTLFRRPISDRPGGATSRRDNNRRDPFPFHRFQGSEVPEHGAQVTEPSILTSQRTKNEAIRKPLRH
jgi:hypothetical protein